MVLTLYCLFLLIRLGGGLEKFSLCLLVSTYGVNNDV